MAGLPFLIAAADRPYPTEAVSGDAWRVDWHDGRARVAVVDGLGHGPAAEAAARIATDALAGEPALDPAAAVRHCHGALRGSRGAAIGVTTIDPAAGRVIFAGVGNVEARLWCMDRVTRLSPARGIVGSVLPSIRPVSAPISGPWLLVVHTDGVSGRFDLSDVSPADQADPQRLADALLARWGRATDDATVVVVRGETGAAAETDG